MIKEFLLKGLNCANCAAKIENALKNQKGIMSASINFMSATLTTEVSEENADILSCITKIVHKYEPDIVVVDKNVQSENLIHIDGKLSEGSEKNWRLIRLYIGAVVFFAAISLEHFFSFNKYIVILIFVIGYLILGLEIVLRAGKNIIRGKVFDENFLMSLATIGAFATANYSEAVAVMLFYQIGEYFQDSAVKKSKKSIADLMDIRPDFANLEKEGKLIKVHPNTVNIGDIIMVKPGEKIPLDGIIIAGKSTLDTSALTGEAVPRSVGISDRVLSGCINISGAITIQVTETFGESTVAKIIELVENAGSKKAETENYITAFSAIYTPAVVILAGLLAVIPPLFFDGLWSDWINRGLIFLVISCPCALVVSIPLGFFGGIGNASKRGILVKGGNYIEALNNLDIIVFDKTGTLTKGVFEVTKVIPKNSYNKETLIELAAHAEAFSNHPIGKSVVRAYGNEITRERITDYSEISGQGIKAVIRGKKVLAGNKEMMAGENILFDEPNFVGTKIFMAVDGVFAGTIIISDEIKPDSKETIAKLKAMGVRKTVMLTGDNALIAETIADELGIDEVYSGLLPHQKVEKVEALVPEKLPKGKLAYVGDGINDAPVLARADIGIAMGGLGSDAAIEAADVVLMTDEPAKLPEAIDVARFTKKIVLENIFFALGIKGLFLILGAFGVAGMWEAVFADVGVSVLAILNSLRLIRNTDNKEYIK